jgi:hypothetical protein
MGSRENGTDVGREPGEVTREMRGGDGQARFRLRRNAGAIARERKGLPGDRAAVDGDEGWDGE